MPKTNATKDRRSSPSVGIEKNSGRADLNVRASKNEARHQTLNELNFQSPDDCRRIWHETQSSEISPFAVTSKSV